MFFIERAFAPTCFLSIAVVFAGGCVHAPSPRSAREASATLPIKDSVPETFPLSPTVTLETPQCALWPRDVPVTLICTMPAGKGPPVVVANYGCIREEDLASLRKNAATLRHQGKDKSKRFVALSERTHTKFDPQSPDATLWIVVRQNSFVPIRSFHSFHILESFNHAELVGGERTLVRGHLRMDHMQPGVVEAYVLWTEFDVEIARSPVVELQLTEETPSWFTTSRPSSAPAR